MEGDGVSDWSAIRYIAHRCGGALAPENSLAGLVAAHAQGLRAVEFDVMLSGDGTPAVIHDETLERTTNGVGRVADTPDAILFGLSLARGRFAQFTGERVPPLAAVAARCRELDLLANVEIKPSEGTAVATAQRVVADVQQLWAGGRAPLLSSFSEDALAVAQELAPEIPRALLVERVPADWAQRLTRLGCCALHCNARQWSWRWLAAAQEKGLDVRCYTVNRPWLAQRLLQRGVAAVFTDAIDRVVGANAS